MRSHSYLLDTTVLRLSPPLFFGLEIWQVGNDNPLALIGRQVDEDRLANLPKICYREGAFHKNYPGAPVSNHSSLNSRPIGPGRKT